jgi:hypothetical protein
MHPSTIIGIVVGLIALAGIASIFLRALRYHFVTWRPTQHHATWYSDDPGVTPEEVERALDLAVGALAKHGPWRRPTIERALEGAKILITPANSFIDPWNRKVGGLAGPKGVIVGRDLAALCHEIAHLLEMAESGPEFYNVEHHGWGERGVWAATDSYTEALRGA